ncbi:MAG: HK97 family phage prohead protease [Elusimicrobiota bacterium]
METRTAILEKVPFRFPLTVLKFATEDSGEFHVIGYAATTDFDLQGDVISESAIKASAEDLLNNSTVLLNHDLNDPIGKVTKADFDERGLLIDALISKTVPDVIEKIKEGVLNKFSIRGQVLERHQEYMAEYQKVVNVIDKMSLVEVSLVSVPANPEAKAIGWYVSKALGSLTPRDRKSEGGAMPENELELEEIVPEELVKSKKPKEDDEEEVEKDQAEPNVGDKNGTDPIGRVVTDGRSGRNVFQYARGRKAGKEEDDEGDDKEKAKPSAKPPFKKNPYSMLAPMLDPVWPLLDKIVGQGGAAMPIAQQIKVYLKRIVGDNSYPYPSTYPKPAKSVAVAVSVGEDDEIGDDEDEADGVDMDENGDGTDTGMGTGKGGVNRNPYVNPALTPEGAKVRKMISKEVRRQVEAILGGVPTVRKGLVQQEAESDAVKKQFDGLDPQQKLKVALALQHQG